MYPLFHYNGYMFSRSNKQHWRDKMKKLYTVSFVLEVSDDENEGLEWVAQSVIRQLEDGESLTDFDVVEIPATA